MTPSVRSAFLRYLSAVFNVVILKDWCRKNPVKQLGMERIKMRRELLSNDQVKAFIRSGR